MDQPLVTAYGRRNVMERNISITVDVLNGAKLTDLASAHGITAARVRQIVLKCCNSANKAWYAAMPGNTTGDLKWLREHRKVFIDSMPTTGE